MSSFQISISPSRRVAARFIEGVRRALQKALAEEERENGVTQADIARRIGVNRSVIHRELRGHRDITLGRLAELAWAMGREPSFSMPKIRNAEGANHPGTLGVVPTAEVSGFMTQADGRNYSFVASTSAQTFPTEA